jgi:hypothetical protein
LHEVQEPQKGGRRFLRFLRPRFAAAGRLTSGPAPPPPAGRTRRYRDPERDDFSSNRHHVPASRLSMIFSENRRPLFGIML